MAYTRKDSPSKTNGQPSVNFGGQVMDGNRVAIQGISSGFITTDATAIPVVSPVTLSGANTILTVPANAVSITIVAGTAVASVSEDVAFASSVTIPVGGTLTIDVARQKFVYLRGTTATSFLFNLVD